MPPKKTISREHVDDAAFKIARTEGIEAVSARRIAQELGCSTQPVYSAYASMPDVHEAVMVRTRQVADSFLSVADPAVPPLLQIGLQTLKFANKEPHLFRLVSDFMRGQLGKKPPAEILTVMRADPIMSKFSEAQLIRVHDLTWTFTQGLAAMVGPASSRMTMALAREYLQRAGLAVIQFELQNPS
jgi:AcrR family transcriptional regulator